MEAVSKLSKLKCAEKNCIKNSADVCMFCAESTHCTAVVARLSKGKFICLRHIFDLNDRFRKTCVSSFCRSSPFVWLANISSRTSSVFFRPVMVLLK